MITAIEFCRKCLALHLVPVREHYNRSLVVLKTRTSLSLSLENVQRTHPRSKLPAHSPSAVDPLVSPKSRGV
jgi:hypothetical protein